MSALTVQPPADTEIGDGIHDELAPERYHAIERCSQSRLKAFARSPAHCHALMSDPPDSEALVLGSATHTAILEPDEFHRRYMFAPECDRRTTAGKAIWADAQLVGARTGRAVLAHKHLDAIHGMVEAMARFEAARDFLAAVAVVERSILWHEGGVGCKLRLDGLVGTEGGGIVLDVKTCQDARPAAFERDIFRFGYYRQGGMYRRGIRAVGEPWRAHVIIAVEKKPPHGVCVYQLEPEAVDAGERDALRLIPLYGACAASGEWPGYTESIRTISLPSYAWREIEEGSES